MKQWLKILPKQCCIWGVTLYTREAMVNLAFGVIFGLRPVFRSVVEVSYNFAFFASYRQTVNKVFKAEKNKNKKRKEVN